MNCEDGIGKIPTKPEPKRGFKWLPPESCPCTGQSYPGSEETDPAFYTVDLLAEGQKSSDPTVKPGGEIEMRARARVEEKKAITLFSIEEWTPRWLSTSDGKWREDPLGPGEPYPNPQK